MELIMMTLKKNNTLKLIILVTIIILLIGIAMRNNEIQTPNRFGIVETDSFCLSHCYNVNGIVGFEKKEFTSEEKQQVLKFIASLDNEVLLETEPPKIIYGIPKILTVSTKDYKIVFYLHRTKNIEVKQSDRDGNLLSRKRYTTTAEQMKVIYRLLGLPDKHPS